VWEVEGGRGCKVSGARMEARLRGLGWPQCHTCNRGHLPSYVIHTDRLAHLMNSLLQDACMALDVSDATLLPAAARKLLRVVSAVPGMEAFISQVHAHVSLCACIRWCYPVHFWRLLKD
jgi:hypothetical protein